MSNALNVVKVIGAWGCLIAACVCLFLPAAGAVSLVLPLAVLSVAFSQAPNG